MARPTRLSRYILRELTSWTLLAVALWTSVLLMNSFFLVARLSMQRGLPASSIAQLVLLNIPEILLLSLPMGTLLGVLIAVGRLSSDHEIVAVQSAGLGPRFLLRPVLVLGVLATLAAVADWGWIRPAANYRSRTIMASFAAVPGIANEIRPRVFIDQVPGFVLYVDGMPPGSRGRAQGVLLYQSDAGNGEEQLILAREAELSSSAGTAGAVNVRLQDGVSHRFRAARPEGYRIARFDEYGPIPLAPPDYLRGSSRPPTPGIADMSPRQLIRELELASSEPDPVMRPIRVRSAWVEAHARLAVPTACLVFAILALPLGITRARSGKGAAFAVSLVVILTYWLLYPSLRNQALAGHIPIALGVWATDVIMLIVAGFAYARMRRPPRDTGFLGSMIGRIGALARRFFRRTPARKVLPPTQEHDEEPASPVFSRYGGLRVISRLDAYVMKHYVKLAVLAGSFTYLIFLLVEVKRWLDIAATRRAGAGTLLAYLAWFTPGTLGFVVPIASLIGAVVTCTVLGRHGELTAMKAGGMSMRRAIVPILVVTLAVCAVSFAVQDHVAPDANRRAQEIKDESEGRSPRSYGRAMGGRWIFGEGGLLYHYRVYDPVARQFQGLSTMRLDLASSPPRFLSHCYATSSLWEGGLWQMKEGWCREFTPQGDAGEFETFAEKHARMDPPEQFERQERTLVRGGDITDEMSLEELRDQIDSLTLAGYDTTRLGVAWHSKIARPLTPLVMVLLGLPFAFKVGRRGSMYGVGVALALVIVYWAGFAISNALGLEAMLPPVLAAWAPNILFAGLGSYLLLFIKT